MPVGAQCAGQRGVDPVGVAPVRHDHDRAAAAGQGGLHRLGDPIRPGRPGQGGPGGTRRTAVGKCGQEGGPVGVGRPAVDRRESRRRLCRQRRRRLDPGVPGRQRQAQHVGQRAGRPVGDRPGQPGDLGAEHRLGRDGPLDRREPPRMVRRGDPVEHETADQPTGEAHPDPAARHHRRGQGRRDGVVERPVQMRQPGLHGHPGDR